MKKEIAKTKKFEISEFEILESNGKALVQGGFSVAIEYNAASGGTNEGCTVINNCFGANCSLSCGPLKDIFKPR